MDQIMAGAEKSSSAASGQGGTMRSIDHKMEEQDNNN